MQPDDHVCLCHRVSLHKLRAFIERERPAVASRLSECLGAGTSCGWCVPFLEHMHAQSIAGEAPEVTESPEEYAARRKEYKLAKAEAKAKAADAANVTQTDTPSAELSRSASPAPPPAPPGAG